MGFETGAGEFMQAGSYTAAQMRRSAFAWAARTAANTEGTIAGGLLSSSDMQLSAAVSGLVVYTSVGACIVGGSEVSNQGGYHGFLSSQNSTTLATANASNPRIDLICVTVADAQYTIPSGGTSGYVTVQAVTGTPTSGATLTNLSGAGSLPASSLLLGYVLVPAAATSLVSADILNVAKPVAIGGGPWTAISSLATHVTAGVPVPQVRSNGYSVQGSGMLVFDSTGVATSGTICTLPAALWPSGTRYGFYLASGYGAQIATISTSGVVTASAAYFGIVSTTASLDSLTYSL